MDKHYTIFIDGKLYIDLIGGITNTASWADSGIIFTSLKAVYDFVDHLNCYCKFEGSTIQVRKVIYEERDYSE